jgi:hypothetical protein
VTSALRRIVALAAFVLAAPAAAGDFPFGNLTLTVDQGIWYVEPLVPGQIIRVTCFSRDCPGFDGLRPDLYALARPASPTGWRTCDSTHASLLMNDNEYGAFSYGRTTHAGVEFHVTGLVSACGRLRQPLLIQACGERDGMLYWLTTSFSGCSPEPDLPKARFDEILEGLTTEPVGAE